MNTNFEYRGDFKIKLISCILFFFVISSQIAFGQTVFESKNGESIIVKYLGSIITFNSANGSIRAGFMLNANGAWRLGFDVTGKSTEGVASLFSNSEILAGTKICSNIGYILGYHEKVEKYGELIKRISDIDIEIEKEEKKELDVLEKEYEELVKEINPTEPSQKKLLTSVVEKVHQIKTEMIKKKWDAERKNRKSKVQEEVIEKLDNMPLEPRKWLNLRIGYENSKFRIFSPDALFDKQIEEELFNGVFSQLSYNIYFFEGQTLLSLAVGFGNSNNASWLRKVNLTERIVYNDPNGENQRIEEKNITARRGKFEKFNLGYIQAGMFWKPFKEHPFGILGYGRYSDSGSLRAVNLGLGFYITRKKNALDPIGGINVEYEDKYGSEIEVIPFGKRFKVNLVINYPIILKK